MSRRLFTSDKYASNNVDWESSPLTANMSFLSEEDIPSLSFPGRLIVNDS